MKNKKWLIGAATLALLTGCAGGGNVDSIVEGFDSTVKGAMTFTYDADYKVDVAGEQKGLDGFKHDVDDKTVGEVDFTAGNLYLHIKRDGKDGAKTSKAEALLYKDGDKYTYVTDTMENAKTLATEAEALAKIDDLLNRVSYNLAGYVDSKTFVYNTTNYEWKEFGLQTPNQAADEFAEPTRELNDKGGIKVTADLDYVGYKTDGGISDFPGKDGGASATIALNTNEKGYVLDYVETFNSSLAMPIMNPAPVVTITGTKTFAAKYDQTITRVTSITHAKTEVKVELPALTQGSIEVKTGKEATEASCTTAVTNGQNVVVGEYLAIKVTPAGTNTIRNITVGGQSVVDPKKDTWYFFEIVNETAKIGVNFIGDAVVEGEFAKIELTLGEGVTVVEKWSFNYNDFGGTKVELNYNAIPTGAEIFAGFKVTVPEGKVAKTTCTEETMIMTIMGYECVNMKEAKTYHVTIKAVDPEDTSKVATLNAPIALDTADIKYQYSTKDDKETLLPLPVVKVGEGQQTSYKLNLKVGDNIVVFVTPKEGNTVTSVLNGETAANFAAGTMYSFAIKEGENKINITINGEAKYTEAKATFKENADLTEQGLQYFTLDDGFKPGEKVEAGSALTLNSNVMVNQTVAQGKQVDAMYVNGLPMTFMFKWYFVPATAGNYVISGATSAVPAAPAQ